MTATNATLLHGNVDRHTFCYIGLAALHIGRLVPKYPVELLLCPHCIAWQAKPSMHSTSPHMDPITAQTDVFSITVMLVAAGPM